MIVQVTDKNIEEAGRIHSLSWCDSHKDFCTDSFIKQHSVENQIKYLKNEVEQGKKLFMLVEDKGVGIGSIDDGDMIENLYILPEMQHKGYGTKILKFLMSKCKGTPSLWILENNVKAYNLYSKYGFVKSGKVHKLSEDISELEMVLK
ncbi:MAG: GNAT family N-acetyltransferase [Clostridiaceae bacterium]|nr:GNAT family N-acetyltransferase [Clostridiaceae bacterium]